MKARMFILPPPQLAVIPLSPFCSQVQSQQQGLQLVRTVEEGKRGKRRGIRQFWGEETEHSDLVLLRTRVQPGRHSPKDACFYHLRHLLKR